MTQTLNGTVGNDPLTGTDPGNPVNPDGIDIINGLAGNDTLSGLGGNDIIQGGLGADAMGGGAGIDTLSFADATAGVGVALNAFGVFGEAVGDTMSGFENILGSAFGDQLAGDGAANVIDAGAGNDYIQISGGADNLNGGAGSQDILDCRVVGAVNINLTAGTGTGGLTLAGLEWVLGSGFDDVLTANLNVGTTLAGFVGDDTLNGANGADKLYGDSFAGINGTGSDTLSGGAGNDLLDGGVLGDKLNGGADVDTAGYTGSTAGVTVNLITGTGTGGDAQGDTLTDIENVNGSGLADALTGSAIANTFNGGGGDDVLDGRAGADTLNGGAGIDTATYAASTAGVTVNLITGTGTGGDAQGDTLSAIENLVGSNFADILTGNTGANALSGADGNDLLNGGAGGDALQGGAGIDTVTYAASATGVLASLATGTGTGGDAQGDTFTGIENVTGSAFSDVIDGDAGTNVLDGGNSDDSLSGLGGADILQGGAGTDEAGYHTSAAGVQVNLGTGIGTGGDAQGDVLSNIENLFGSNFDDVLTGNGTANVLIGAGGSDTLDGGAGDDVLSGGAGDDLFRVDSAADKVNETIGEGTDTVVVTISYALGTGQAIEFLETSDATGTAAIDLRGNAFQQTIEGNNGDNLLHDGGTGPLKGDGVPDTLIGHGGDDSYVVYDAEAAIVEVAGEGHDKLASGAHFVLGDDISIEYLSTSSQVATYAIDLTGNNLGQWVRGSNGVNVLDGGGGIDTLWGMGGADSFRFSTAIGFGNVDRIADFSAADDTIQLDDAIFTALTTLGTLDASAFKDIGVAGQDADDRILYNSKNGSLFYDADGSGSGATPIKFAMLSPGLGLTAADFVVI